MSKFHTLKTITPFCEWFSWHLSQTWAKYLAPYRSRNNHQNVHVNLGCVKFQLRKAGQLDRLVRHHMIMSYGIPSILSI